MNKLGPTTKLAAIEAAASVRSQAFGLGLRFSALSRINQLLLIAFITLSYYGTHAGYAFAAGEGCNSGAAANIVAFIDSGVQFLMIIAGVLAVLMAVVGGALVITGGNSNRTKMGFEFLKNSIIGLGIVAIAVVIQEVVLDFLSGASGQNTPGCLEDGNQGSKVGS